jgi:hypothetical protein
MTNSMVTVEQMIQESLTDPRLSDLDLERIDEIHRSAMQAAADAGAASGYTGVDYARALLHEFQKRVSRIKRIRERAAVRREGLAAHAESA